MRNHCTIYVSFSAKGAKVAKTYTEFTSDEEATEFARTKIEEGVIAVEKIVYVRHDLKETKRMTSKKPYWHEV